MQVIKPFPFRAPARNGALLYMACGNVSVRSARLLPGSLTCHRSRQLASLCSVQGARPLRRSAATPMMLLHHFLPAGHAKHGAAPTGAFDWTQSGQSGAWGNPNKLHRNIENDIPMPCLPVLTLTACTGSLRVLYCTQKQPNKLPVYRGDVYGKT